MAELEKVKQGIKACWSEHWCHKCFNCPYKPHRDNDDTCVERLGADALELLKEQPIWNDASKRPPKQGRYLVWGLHEFTPDHNDQPNAYWQTRIATWFDKTGWDTKVKFWMELPEPPENKGRWA